MFWRYSPPQHPFLSLETRSSGRNKVNACAKRRMWEVSWQPILVVTRAPRFANHSSRWEDRRSPGRIKILSTLTTPPFQLHFRGEPHQILSAICRLTSLKRKENIWGTAHKLQRVNTRLTNHLNSKASLLSHASFDSLPRLLITSINKYDASRLQKTGEHACQQGTCLKLTADRRREGRGVFKPRSSAIRFESQTVWYRLVVPFAHRRVNPLIPPLCVRRFWIRKVILGIQVSFIIYWYVWGALFSSCVCKCLRIRIP